MARSSSADKYETNVCVSFVATFRATLEFFAKKDVVMLEYHPKPFPHWQRSDRHFNLISTEARRVIRFEGNRFVVRVEGYSSLDPYYETLALARRMCDIFNVADIFSTAFTLTKTHALPSRQESRKAFAKLFLSPLTQDWLPQDGATDYAMTLDRSKTVSPELVEMKPALAPLRLRHQYQIGPSDYNEV